MFVYHAMVWLPRLCLLLVSCVSGSVGCPCLLPVYISSCSCCFPCLLYVYCVVAFVLCTVPLFSSCPFMFLCEWVRMRTIARVCFSPMLCHTNVCHFNVTGALGPLLGARGRSLGVTAGRFCKRLMFDYALNVRMHVCWIAKTMSKWDYIKK